MEQFSVGQRVEFEGFGEGTVVECINAMGEVEVAFSEGETLWISTEELKKI